MNQLHKSENTVDFLINKEVRVTRQKAFTELLRKTEQSIAREYGVGVLPQRVYDYKVSKKMVTTMSSRFVIHPKTDNFALLQASMFMHQNVCANRKSAFDAFNLSYIEL